MRLSRLLFSCSFTLFIVFVLSTTVAKASNLAEPVEFEALMVIYHTHEIEVNLEIPVLKSMENEDIQDKLNTMFEDHAEAFVREVYSWYEEYAQMAKEYDFEPHTFVAYTRYSVTFNEAEILSIPVTYYQYTGGAHGMTEIRSYNIDLRNGNLFELKNILDDRQLATVNAEIKRQLLEDTESYFPEAAESFEGVADNQGFYLKNGELVIYFQLYELQPYALGFPEFIFSLDSLELSIEQIRHILSEKAEPASDS